MSTKQEQEVEKWRKEARELKKVVKEKDKQIEEHLHHIKFLNERLEAWAERNWNLRTEFLNINVDKFLEKKQKMLEGFNKDEKPKKKSV
tara:strand:- start:141 stop:407 length:267 start_codon:yes stop_codon:yes gene_type:complete